MERLLKVLFFSTLVVYFVATVAARVPAQWPAWVILKYNPNLSLTGVSGTAWRGNAASAQTRVGTQMLDLGAVTWKLNGLALFSLKACVTLESPKLRGNLCRSITGKNIARQLVIEQVPVELLNGLVGAQLGGLATFTVEQGQITDKGQIDQLQGKLTWQNARVNVGTGWFALGTYAADLTNAEGGITAHVTDVDGEFTVAVDGTYIPGQPPRAKGTVKPKPGAQQPLLDALSLISETLEDGSYRITWPMGG